MVTNDNNDLGMRAHNCKLNRDPLWVKGIMKH